MNRLLALICYIYSFRCLSTVQNLYGSSQPNDTVQRLTRPYHYNSQNSNVKLMKKMKETPKINGTPNTTTVEDSPCTVKSLTVYCSELSIKTIHPFWFPSNVQVILLNGNYIKSIQNFTFAHVTDLMMLDLSNNKISELQIKAFEGLIHLETLLLNDNNLCFNTEDIFKETFFPLQNLKELNLIQINNDANCSDTQIFIEPLKKLRKLSMKSMEQTLYLGSVFLKLTNLEVLEITGDSQILDNDTFQNVGGLKEIFLRDMTDIVNISQNVFYSFTNLKSLKMLSVRIGVQRVLSLLEPFVGRNMSDIYLNKISTSTNLATPMINGDIRADDTKNLMGICLQNFTLIDSFIVYIEPNAFEHTNTWQNCLSHFGMSFNPLQGNVLAFYAILRLNSIETLTVDNDLRQCNGFPSFPHSLNERYTNMNVKMVANTNVVDMTNENDNENICNVENEKETQLTYWLSNSLNILQIGRLVSSLSWDTDIMVFGANKLKYLNIEDSGFQKFCASIQGFHALETAIISGNNMRQLSTHFFDGFYNLENLALSKCALERDFIGLNSRRIFQNLTHLKQLDLSFNYLNGLSIETFVHNSELNWLDLSENQFREIPFNLKHTPNLIELDIRFNAINTLSQNVAGDLDYLAKLNGRLYLFLNGNILSCGCNDIQFLQWLRNTLVTLDQEGNFICINQDGERSSTMFYPDVDTLWRLCWGKYFLSLAVIIACLYLTGVFALILCLKNKRFLMSFFFQVFGNFKLHKRGDFMIDVYIGYSDKLYRFPCKDLREYLEDTLGFKTFLNDRDLLVNSNKASGIVSAINSSWRVLLVCSESFLKDEDWSLFTMRSAMYAQSPANPARVVVMVHKRCLHLLPAELLSVVNDDNILAVSGWKLNYTIQEALRTRLM